MGMNNPADRFRQENNPLISGGLSVQDLRVILSQNPDSLSGLTHQELETIAAKVTPGMNLSEVIEKVNRASAKKAIKAEYRRRGGNTKYGALGSPVSDVTKSGDDRYSQEFEYGKITTRNINIPDTDPFYVVDLFVAAIKCFGSEDPGGIFDGGEGEDEPYLIITTVNTASAFLDGYEGSISRTWRSPTFRNISKRDIFGENLEIFRGLKVGPYGVRLKIALMEHEHGDEEQLRKKVEEKGRKIVNEVKDIAAAIAGVSVDEALSDQALDSEILDTLGDLSVDLITDILKDDKIDEKEWVIDGTMLKNWVDQGLIATSDVHYPPTELPPHIKTNFPRENVFDRTWLFSGGGGSYKVYLLAIPWFIDPQSGPRPNR